MKLEETKYPALPIEGLGDSIPPSLVEKIQQQGLFSASMVDRMINDKNIDRFRLETPTFCSKCGKSYYRKDVLQRHMKECGQTPHLTCTLCPYRTFRKGNLMRHSMKHMKSIAEHDPDAPKCTPGLIAASDL